MFFPRAEDSRLADGFTLLGSTLLHCGAVLKGTLSGLFVSPAALQFLLFHRFVSRKHCLFALFVPRIYLLLSLRAISKRIGKSPVCDFRGFFLSVRTLCPEACQVHSY